MMISAPLTKSPNWASTRQANDSPQRSSPYSKPKAAYSLKSESRTVKKPLAPPRFANGTELIRPCGSQ
jgi:hypothetical protein